MKAWEVTLIKLFTKNGWWMKVADGSNVKFKEWWMKVADEWK